MLGRARRRDVGRNGLNTPAEHRPRFKQHIVRHALLFQQVGRVQPAQAASDDGHACGWQAHGDTPSAAKWPVFRYNVTPCAPACSPNAVARGKRIQLPLG